MSENFVNKSSPDAWAPVKGKINADITINTAVGTFGTLDKRSRRVTVQNLTAAVRVTYDGSTPVAGTHGFVYGPGTILQLSRDAALAAKFVSDTGTAGKYVKQEMTY